jgi:hypothetical protein
VGVVKKSTGGVPKDKNVVRSGVAKKSTGGVPKDNNLARSGVAKKSTGCLPEPPILILVKPESTTDLMDERVPPEALIKDELEDDNDVFPCNDDDVEYVPEPVDVGSDDSCPSFEFEFGGDDDDDVDEEDDLSGYDDNTPAFPLSPLKIVSVRTLPKGEEPNPFVSMSKVDPETLKTYGIKVKKPRVRRKYGAEAKIITKGPYTCDKCNEVFLIKKEYLRHMPKHKVPKRYTCQICGFITAHKSYHFVHVRTHTGEKPNLCEICGYAANSMQTLKSHRKRMHHREELEMKYFCSFCGKRFETRKVMLQHESRTHKEVNEFAVECELCKFVCSGKAIDSEESIMLLHFSFYKSFFPVLSTYALPCSDI